MPPRSSDPLVLREAVRAGDVGAVRQLVEAAGVFSPEEAGVAASLVETTLSGAETYRFVFAEVGDRLLGYACFDRIPLSAVSYDLYWIVVAPEARGTGLGRRLIAQVADRARAEGALQIFAETSMRADYGPARAFYERAGFTAAARFADFYARDEDKLVLRLELR
ncbi:GNAT family N-acetyltransferase [Arsenicitalea aurantiaca]|uniref:GNAT family N-acetyltransferase n=1 Tax=Arsenicitalea aurantiaca TaxID=1783274 RepID=UPI00131525E9|nr:GNAT family N-acetyltransferase [Arsenicitalea aurantiaca]